MDQNGVKSTYNFLEIIMIFTPAVKNGKNRDFVEMLRFGLFRSLTYIPPTTACIVPYNFIVTHVLKTAGTWTQVLEAMVCHCALWCVTTLKPPETVFLGDFRLKLNNLR